MPSLAIYHKRFIGMYTLLPFILILVSLATILVVVIRKFPQLSLLDIEKLPEVQEEVKKNEVLKKRVKKKTKESKEKTDAKVHILLARLKKVQLQFRQYVGVVERRIIRQKIEHKKQEQINTPETTQTEKEKVSLLLKDAEHAFQGNQFDSAETKYIAVIRLDNKNEDAYKGLIDVYVERDQLEEAAETCSFLLQLNPKNELAHVRMAEIAEQDGDIQKAIDHYQEAVIINHNMSPRFAKLADLLVRLEQYETALEAINQAIELEPENPKYLDNFVHIAILVGNKKLAKEAYDKLRQANPTNNKLDSLKQKIDKMGNNN